MSTPLAIDTQFGDGEGTGAAAGPSTPSASGSSQDTTTGIAPLSAALSPISPNRTRPRSGSRSRPGMSSRCLSYEAIQVAPPMAREETPERVGVGAEHLPTLPEGIDTAQGPTTLQTGRGSTPSGVKTPPQTPLATSFAASAFLNTSPNGSGTSPRRSRAHTVSVTMPSRLHHTGAKLSVPPRSSTHDVEAQHGGLDSEFSSPRNSIIVTVPEAHDTDVADHQGHLNDDMVGLLDCVDPEVGTMNHLQNITNGIMVPNIPMFWTRRPNITIQHEASYQALPELAADGSQSPASPHAGRGRASTMTSWIPLYGRKASAQQQDLLPTTTVSVPTPERVRRGSAESAPGEMELNEMMALNKLDEELSEEADEVSKEHDLDRHVKHVLERKQKARRALRGLWAYLKTPMGAITAIYGFLVAFWGAAIVLFLLGWIPTNSKNTQDIWVEISSQVTNGLFTVTGVGLIPWRVVDTYRMSIIHTLKMRIRRRRKQRGLPPIEDEDDMPDPRLVPGYERVLTDKEEKQLQYQQEKFAQSQTWYRPHATATHRAFPITLALWNTILMDGNSFFQCILCGCMWGMNRHQRPAWTTGTLIPCSFLCGIAAAVLIWQGGVRTKKTVAVEAKLRKALGVDEKVPETVKRPRRATVSGARPDINAGAGAGAGATVSPRIRRSTVGGTSPALDVSPLPTVPAHLRKDPHPDFLLAAVDEEVEATSPAPAPAPVLAAKRGSV